MDITIDLSKGDIFLVDDIPANLALLEDVLRESDYFVRGTTSGLKALQMVREDRPDLILLDISMPEINGYEVCRRLKADPMTKEIPVIFISGLDEALDKVKAFEVGGIDYIVKPFQFAEVLARIENQLNLSRLKKKLERKQRELEHQNAELVRKNEELNRSQKRTDLVFHALSDVLPGTVLDGKYRLETKIGSGGFGAVYKATHVTLNRPVAVKIFRPLPCNDTPEGLERFRLEGISACRLRHPNAVTVLDFSVSDAGMAYLVMELLQGHTLGEELRKNWVLTPRRCAEILLPICEVLTAAHAGGMIHRDIKPDNIFLHQIEAGEVVKVVDFGTAKLLDESAVSLGVQNLTEAGGLLGTPLYMSPERLKGEDYDGKADVYSVGVMLYQMLSGKTPFPFTPGSIYPLITSHLTKEPPPLRELNPYISEDLERVVMQTLKKTADERPSASELGLMFMECVNAESGLAGAGDLKDPTPINDKDGIVTLHLPVDEITGKAIPLHLRSRETHQLENRSVDTHSQEAVTLKEPSAYLTDDDPGAPSVP